MASKTSSALGPESILSYISKSIPEKEQDKLAIKNPFSAVALFTHACMLAVGFKLIGLGEDDRIEAHSEPSDVQRLPREWDSQSSYAFRYSHSQSSMEYMIKVTRLGKKAIILGVGLGDDKTAQVEIKAEDYISENSLKDVSTDPNATDTVKHVFISSGRITDLSALLKLNVIQKLIPGLRKEGYEDTTEGTTQEGSSRAPRQQRRDEQDQRPEVDPLRDDQPAPARPYPFDDPLADVPRRPRPIPDFAPPGFEDEHELQNPRMAYPGGRQPFGNIGERDLYPPGLGPHDPLRIGPGGGYRGGGGMHPTFDDPLFRGQGGQGEYNPMAPPGARYDPVGPGDGPNLRGGPRFPGGGGGGMGGRPPNPFGGFGSGDFI